MFSLVQHGKNMFYAVLFGYIFTLLCSFIYSGGLVVICERLGDRCLPLAEAMKWLGPFGPCVLSSKDLSWTKSLYRASEQRTHFESYDITLMISNCITSLILFQVAWGFFWPCGFVVNKNKQQKHFSKKKSVAKGTQQIIHDRLSVNQRGQQDRCLLDKDNSYVYEQRKIVLRLRVTTLGRDPIFVVENCRHNIAVLEDYNRKATEQDNEENDGYSAVVEWAVEVLTEAFIGVEYVLSNHAGKIDEILVPKNYRTPNESYAKARALHYANEPNVSGASSDDFMVHLDEESLFDGVNCIKEIRRHCVENPYKIGQGMIVYGRKNEVVNMFTTLIDSARVLMDYTAYRVFFSLGVGVNGMKGSFVVVNNKVEKAVSYDVGKRCSLTEDAAFALFAMQKGYRMAYIPAVVLEQSPFTIMDLLKQRRRWIRGLIRVCTEPAIHLKWRFVLTWLMFSWCNAPATILCTWVTKLLYGIPFNAFTVGTFSFIQATAIYGYIFGTLVNFGSKTIGHLQKILLIAVLPFIFPILPFAESAAIVYALFTTPPGFEVINKCPETFSAASSPIEKSDRQSLGENVDPTNIPKLPMNMQLKSVVHEINQEADFVPLVRKRISRSPQLLQRENYLSLQHALSKFGR